ncbi:MAG: hypothetical protein NXH75_03540 [Halobacteriovoraceae bacterium]|nr:hypothetical protein [Halobacteriovoraceae bacterium]
MKLFIAFITLFLSLNAFSSTAEEESFAIKNFNERCNTELTRSDIAYNEELDSDYDYFSIVVGFENEGQVYMTIRRVQVRGEYDDDDYGYNGYSKLEYYVDEIFCTNSGN